MPKIDINTATARQLTQLPGIAKNLAYKIVNHRERHGFFTDWSELNEVKGFPAAKLAQIRDVATLTCPGEACAPPRHQRSHTAQQRKKPGGYTRSIRSTRMSDRLKAA